MSDDIRIDWDVDLMEGDFLFDADIQDLESDAGLETAIIISLFTDRRAGADDILPDPNNLNRRGWWGDLAYPEVEGDQIGSRLWLFEREKTLESVLAKVKKYAEESLSWVIEDEVAVKVDVSAERLGPVGTDKLALLIQIYKIDGAEIAYKYEAQWAAQALRG